jgi:ribosomal protein L6P/L9E
MKNKNNVTVTELVNAIVKLQEKKGNRDSAHSYALGTIQAILDWEVKGYNKGFKSLQEVIDDSYSNVMNEMNELKEPLTAVTDYPTD